MDWVHTPELNYEERMHRYMDNSFLPRSFEIHWLSIINSSVLVILLTAFLAVIMMRILKKDFSKYVEVDEEDIVEEEPGWKLIHGDVFRAPKVLSLFCALVGSGAQIFSTMFILLLCVIMGAFKLTKRGALLTAMILIYALCAFIGGLVSARLYKQLKGKNWAWNVVLNAIGR